MAFTIFLDTYSGKAGDPVSLTDNDGGAPFAEPYTKNVVLFNGVIADILSGDDEELIVAVPQLATTGLVVVHTFLDGSDAEGITYDEFTVTYDDESFTQKELDPYHKGYINSRVKTFSTEPSNTAIYNRDFSYTKYTEIVDENSMVQNFLSLILTGKLERMWEPTLGSNIPELPFKLIGSIRQLETDILSEADRLVKTYEPRIALILSQSIVDVNPDTHQVNAIFAIQIPTGVVKEIGVTLGQVQNESM